MHRLIMLEKSVLVDALDGLNSPVGLSRRNDRSAGRGVSRVPKPSREWKRWDAERPVWRWS